MPPTALQPAAEPRTGAVDAIGAAEEVGAGSGALATLVAGASGAEATWVEGAAAAGVAWAVCDAKGLENGLPLEFEPGDILGAAREPDQGEASQRKTRKGASFQKRNAITHVLGSVNYATENREQCGSFELRQGLR